MTSNSQTHVGTTAAPGAAGELQRALEYARANGAPEGVVDEANAVVAILSELRLDPDVLTAAALYAALRDHGFEPDRLAADFGPQVARLLEGVARMDFLHQGVVEKGHVGPGQTENLRKMLLAMAEDVRVVLIKLAERTCAMRRLKRASVEERQTAAQEALGIFAPLANRLGIAQLKWELEDLAFRYLHPARYKHIAGLLDERRVDRERYIARVVRRLQRELDKAGIKAEIQGRPKHIYSIWRKMQLKSVDFHELFDVRALRVLVDEVSDCYAALGIVHGLWSHIPGEFDDYIATPKGNMYRSLHTAVRGPEGKTLEVQIRTYEMHQHAELGVAAHWRYKEGSHYDPGFERRIAWLRQLLDWRGEDSEAGDLLEQFKAEAFQDRVYVLTPRGEIIDLPQGATPLDFAYQIHTHLGHRCRGAKVNNRIVPLNYELKSGDEVEVLAAKQGAPSRDWLSPHLGYLKTSRAQARVRQWFKQQDLDKVQAAGRAALDRELRRLGMSGVNLEKLAQQSGVGSVSDMLAAIGRGDITATQIAALVQGALRPGLREEPRPVPRPAGEVGTGAIRVHGVGNLLTTVAGCCKPLPDEPIVGYITRGRGVTIHRRDCSNILRLGDAVHGRLIEVEWGAEAQGNYPVDIQVDAYDRTGLLRDITAILANEKINVVAVNTLSEKSANTAHMRLTLEIADLYQLSRVMERLNALPNVIDARRSGA